MNIIMVLGIALAISLAGNGVLGKIYMGARDARTQAVADRDSARGAAKACSDATEALSDLAAKRKKDSDAEVEAANDRARQAQDEAAQILASPSKVPGNVCASAQAEVDAFIARRDRK